MTTKQKIDALEERLAKQTHPIDGGLECVPEYVEAHHAFKGGFSALKEHTLALAAALEKYRFVPAIESRSFLTQHSAAGDALAKFEAFLEGKDE